jgi:hypothetical protein
MLTVNSAITIEAMPGTTIEEFAKECKLIVDTRYIEKTILIFGKKVCFYNSNSKYENTEEYIINTITGK